MDWGCVGYLVDKPSPMAEQPLAAPAPPFAAPAPAPSLTFVAMAPNDSLEEEFGSKEDFLATQYLPPLFASALEGGHENAEGRIVFTWSRVAAMALLATPVPDVHQSILRKTLSLATINEIFEKLSKYRQRPFMIWPRILVFTSMMLRVLNPAAFGSYGAGILYS